MTDALVKTNAGYTNQIEIIPAFPEGKARHPHGYQVNRVAGPGELRRQPGDYLCATAAKRGVLITDRQYAHIIVIDLSPVLIDTSQ